MEKIKVKNTKTGFIASINPNEFQSTYAPLGWIKIGDNATSPSTGGTAPPPSNIPITPKIPEKITPDILSPKKAEITTNALSQAQQRQKDKEGVLQVYQQRPDAIANEGFVNAAVNAALNRSASLDELGQGNNKFKLTGLTVREVLKRLKLAPDYAVEQPQPPENSLSGAQNAPSQPVSPQSGSITPQTAKQSPQRQIPASQEQPTSVNNKIDELYNSLIAEKSGQGQTADANKYLGEKQKASLDLEKSREAIANKKLIDAVKLKELANQPIPMALISRQQNKYSSDEYINNLKMVQDYNNKLILSKMAEGNYLEAQRLNQQTANDNYEIAKLQLDKLMFDKKIQQDEASRLDQEAQAEKDLALKGYSYIPDTKTYDDLVKKYNVSPATFSNFFYKDPINGKIYLKPISQTAGAYKIIKGAGGHTLAIDEQGNVIKDYGSVFKGTSGGTSSGGGNGTNLTAEDKINAFFDSVKGGDLKVSPADWEKAKQAWIADGGSPTTFDSKFKGWKDPYNYNYK